MYSLQLSESKNRYSKLILSLCLALLMTIGYSFAALGAAVSITGGGSFSTGGVQSQIDNCKSKIEIVTKDIKQLDGEIQSLNDQLKVCLDNRPVRPVRPGKEDIKKYDQEMTAWGNKVEEYRSNIDTKTQNSEAKKRELAILQAELDRLKNQQPLPKAQP